MIRIDFHGPFFRRSVGLNDPTLTLITLTRGRKRETERESFF